MGDLTQNFSRSEFACKCGCGLNTIDENLVDILQHSRTSTGLSYIINSGCRCPAYNEKVGGKSRSAHVACKAVDIDCDNSTTMYLMLKDFIRRFRRIELGEKRYKDGRVSKWIHVDIDDSLPLDVIIIEVIRSEV